MGEANYLDRTSKHRFRRKILGIQHQQPTMLLTAAVKDRCILGYTGRVCFAEQLCCVSAPCLCCLSAPREASHLQQVAGVCRHSLLHPSLLSNSPASARNGRGQRIMLLTAVPFISLYWLEQGYTFWSASWFPKPPCGGNNMEMFLLSLQWFPKKKKIDNNVVSLAIICLVCHHAYVAVLSEILPLFVTL